MSCKPVFEGCILDSGGCKVQTASIMNMVVSTLYAEGFWVPAERGQRLGQMLRRFLVLYNRCASAALHKNLNRFALVPKCHMLSHQAEDMISQSQTSEWVVNPLSTGNQMQEDYIGRPARLSRRVHASKMHTRVIQRSLLASNPELQS